VLKASVSVDPIIQALPQPAHHEPPWAPSHLKSIALVADEVIVTFHWLFNEIVVPFAFGFVKVSAPVPVILIEV